MRITAKNSCLLLLLLAALGCCTNEKNRYVTKTELLEYCNDPENGLIKTTESLGCEITCQFFPCELLPFSANKESPGPECREYIYFKLFFSNKNTHQQCSPETLTDEFFLIENQRDTIRYIDLFREKLAGTNHTQVLVVFPKSNTFGKHDVKIVVRSGEHSGEVDEFLFSGENLTSVPELKL